MPTARASSSAITPETLFRYLPAHRVLICHPCQYAVQPRAVIRHLNEIHRLNHAQRKPFLDYASQFPLAAPQDAVLPNETQFPVPFLPVLNGVACQFPHCEHLCVTAKRMEQHWTSAHTGIDRSQWSWRPVQLQTFFRGNALRYFTSPTSSKNSPNHSAPNETISTDDDLLHHYKTTTYLSLCSDPELEHTVRVSIPELAHHYPFLMHGLLSISALQLAHTNPKFRAQYLGLALDHQELAMPEYRREIMNMTPANSGAVLVFAFIVVVCALATDDEDRKELFLFPSPGGPSPPGSKSGPAEPSSYPSTIHLLRAGCALLENSWDALQAGPMARLALLWELETEHSAVVDVDNDPYLRRLLSVIPSSDAGETAWSDAEVVIYRRTAIQLTEALIVAHQEDIEFTIWGALTIWPLEVSDGYLGLVQASHPGALLLLAHYMGLVHLVKETWYFQGQVGRTLDEIEGRLQGGNTSDEIRRAFTQLRAEYRI
ncbi:hypothetical protein BJY04DRAFT_220309 [Aspergillus karnatakaensis]|uniref:uncharacterized protein n=1 Tax=Aspergillus karnatakaensis TaxID=1810916 RepID=UPI003CCD1F7A